MQNLQPPQKPILNSNARVVLEYRRTHGQQNVFKAAILLQETLIGSLRIDIKIRSLQGIRVVVHLRLIPMMTAGWGTQFALSVGSIPFLRISSCSISTEMR